MRAPHINARRLTATVALLLASCLEICGCNPEREPSGTVPQVYSKNGQTSLDNGTVSGDKSAAAVRGIGLTSVEAATSSSGATPSEVRFAPLSLPESVLFLYRTAGFGNRTPAATAFVLGVSEPGGQTATRYLVTARHVLDPAWAHCSEPDPTSMQLRLYRRGGGVGFETIFLKDEHGRAQYIASSDPTADVAMIPLNRTLIPNLDLYRFAETPSRLLPTKAELSYISSRQRGTSRNLPGQPVTTASLRTQMPDDPSPLLVSESGVLFSTANETVNIQCGEKPTVRPLRVWFIDASVQHGVSGAPVYTSLTRDGDIFPSTVLLGVQSIAWPDRGVAGVTPASALAELVESVVARRAHEQEHAAIHGHFPPPELQPPGAP